jgi:hypothetical protein
MKRTLIGFAVCIFASVVTSASAALIISEVMSSSSVTADWFELTNMGPAAATITGDKMDDDSLAFANSVALLGVASLAPGESAIFIESSAPATDVPAFRNHWTGSTSGLAGVQIGTYSGSGISLSGTNGDALIVFDAGGAILAGPVTYPSATGADAGKSFDKFNPNFHRSTVGQLGALASFGGTVKDVGSPGIAVPEPGTMVLAAAVLSGLGSRGGRRARN